MARVLFFLALLVAAASAFVAPATNAGEFSEPTVFLFRVDEIGDAVGCRTLRHRA